MGLLSKSTIVQSDIIDTLETINRNLWGMMRLVMNLSVESRTAPSLTKHHISEMDRLHSHVDMALVRSYEAYHSRSSCHLWDVQALHIVIDMLDDSDIEDLFPTEQWYKRLLKDATSLDYLANEEVRRLKSDEAPF